MCYECESLKDRSCNDPFNATDSMLKLCHGCCVKVVRGHDRRELCPFPCILSDRIELSLIVFVYSHAKHMADVHVEVADQSVHGRPRVHGGVGRHRAHVLLRVGQMQRGGRRPRAHIPPADDGGPGHATVAQLTGTIDSIASGTTGAHPGGPPPPSAPLRRVLLAVARTPSPL